MKDTGRLIETAEIQGEIGGGSLLVYLCCCLMFQGVSDPGSD